VALADLLSEPGFADTPLAYGTAEGNEQLRQRIAELHDVRANEVVITSGGMHALFLLAFIVCGPEGEAVVTTPIFPPARDCLSAVGATVRTLPLVFAERYQPDVARFRALLSPKTRLVSLCSPQNPSGVAIPLERLREILAAMSEICPEAYLIVDETYREATYGDAPTAASTLTLGERVISVASLSKCHGAPGLRIGWAITRDPILRKQLVVGKFNTVISCSPVDEALALRVLKSSERIFAERRTRLADGLSRTASWIEDNRDAVEWVRPDAGALCCVRLKSAVFDDDAVERFYRALPCENVRVASGAWFGETPRVFRLGFGLLPPAEFNAALRALTVALRKSANFELAVPS
jgi:aspartate/methionine/tyrosine aminotransferase